MRKSLSKVDSRNSIVTQNKSKFYEISANHNKQTFEMGTHSSMPSSLINSVDVRQTQDIHTAGAKVTSNEKEERLSEVRNSNTG
jgi:hypothetical protein